MATANPITTPKQTANQIVITLNVDNPNAVYLDNIEAKVGQITKNPNNQITNVTGEDVIQNIISGFKLDNDFLTNFNTSYIKGTRSSSSGTSTPGASNGPSVSGPSQYTSPKDFQYYSDRIFATDDPTVFTIKAFIEGVSKKNNGKYPPQFAELYDTLYKTISAPNIDQNAVASTVKVAWKRIIKDQIVEIEKNADELWQIVKAHNPFGFKVAGRDANQMIKNFNASYEKLMKNNRNKMPDDYKTALENMNKAINSQYDFYYPDNNDTSKIFNYNKSIKTRVSSEFINLAQNITKINFNPRRESITTDGKTPPSWYAFRGKWNNIPPGDDQVKAFLIEMTKGRATTKITRGGENRTRKIIHSETPILPDLPHLVSIFPDPPSL